MRWKGLVAGVAFGLAWGGGSQWLAARVDTWVWVAALSAPWLAIAFVAGALQRDVRAGVAAGLLATVCALAAYDAMTLSPWEHVVITRSVVLGTVRSQVRWTAAGCLSGPLFGWLGQRWRRRSGAGWWAGPIALCAAACLEPFDGRFVVRSVGHAEMMAGVGLVLVFAADAVWRRSASLD